MKIELLKTFLEVCRTLHFKAAAETLFVTQPAVSARIRLLEEELGVRLFDRNQKQLKLTPEGNRLIKHAREMIFMWQKAKQEVALVDDNIPILSIGSMMSVWDIALQEWLTKVQKNIEDISFITQTHNQLDLKKCLINGVLDVAFSFDAVSTDEIVTEKVTAVPLHLVTTSSIHQCRYHALENFIQVDYGESINLQFLREFDDFSLARHIMGQPKIALNFILENGGSAYLPRQLVTRYINDEKLFKVEDAPIFSREINAMYLERSQKLSLIEKTLKYFPEIVFE